MNGDVRPNDRSEREGEACPQRGEIRVINGQRCRFIERELEGDKWEILGPADPQPLGGEYGLLVERVRHLAAWIGDEPWRDNGGRGERWKSREVLTDAADRLTDLQERLAAAMGLLRQTLSDLDRRKNTADTATRIDVFLEAAQALSTPGKSDV